MKHQILRFLNVFFAIAFCVASGNPAAADDARHDWETGPEFYYYHYSEPGVTHTAGAYYGIYGKYAYRESESRNIDSLQSFFENITNNYVLGLDGRVAVGSVDYSSKSTGEISNIDDVVVEIRGTAGLDVPLNDSFSMTPYLGIGYRWLRDELGGEVSSTGHFGYDRESNYVYLPLGIDLNKSLDQGWSVGLNAEFDVFLTGQQRSELGDVVAGLGTLENDQDTGFGVRGAVRIAREGQTMDFSVEPFVRYWNIDESNSQLVGCDSTVCVFGFEPDNRTVEAGMKMGVNF